MNLYRVRNVKKNSFIKIDRKSVWSNINNIKISLNFPDIKDLEIVEFKLVQKRTIKVFDETRRCKFCGREIQFEYFLCDICGRKFCDSCIEEKKDGKSICYDCNGRGAFFNV